MRVPRFSLACIFAVTSFAIAFPIDAHAGWTDRYEVTSYGSSGGSSGSSYSSHGSWGR